jgi:hypothetical protein
MPLTKVSSGVIAANAVVDSFGTQSITGDKLGLTAINANNIVNSTITVSQLATSLNLATNNVQVASIQSATGTPAITFAANGQMTLANTPLQLTGGQIKFPGTQIASGDANTLDDYEEGTWTPTVTPSSGSLTAYTSSGVYVKVGRLVTITGDFQLTTVGTASGSVSVGGVPFSGTSPSTAYRTAMGSGREDNITGVFYQAVLGGGGNNILLRTAAGANITWTNGYGYIFTVTYQASA